MNEDRVIEFFKKMGLYNEELFKQIKNNSSIINKPANEIIDFIGCYYKEDGSFKIVLPKIINIFDELIWVHEYTHVIFGLTEGEIIPNIMEGIFINMYLKDKSEVIKKTEEEIENSTSFNHTIAKRIKLFTIK